MYPDVFVVCSFTGVSLSDVVYREGREDGRENRRYKKV